MFCKIPIHSFFFFLGFALNSFFQLFSFNTIAVFEKIPKELYDFDS